MKLTIQKNVVVITPTIGKPELEFAANSVAKQTYPCKHLLVVDGGDYVNQVCTLPIDHSHVAVTITPQNTGANGYYGHRIYAAYPHLIDADYILFLDEDNWYHPNHVETLIETIERKDLHFAFSLRQIYSKNGEYHCDDNCESLGKWPIYFTRGSQQGPQYLIDTSSFCFTKDFIQQTCHLWHYGWGGDRRYFYAVKDKAKYDTNGIHSLCYRLDGNANSVTKDFFENGNRIQHEYYGETFPWHLKI